MRTARAAALPSAGDLVAFKDSAEGLSEETLRLSMGPDELGTVGIILSVLPQFLYDVCVLSRERKYWLRSCDINVLSPVKRRQPSV